MTVFRQYTKTGESIDELEDTPAKQKVDELMGRKKTMLASQLHSQEITDNSKEKK